MEEFQQTIKIYIGSGRNGRMRAQNIKRVADILFAGNVSGMVNAAIDKTYGLDPKSGAQLESNRVVVTAHRPHDYNREK